MLILSWKEMIFCINYNIIDYTASQNIWSLIRALPLDVWYSTPRSEPLDRNDIFYFYQLNVFLNHATLGGDRKTPLIILSCSVSPITASCDIMCSDRRFKQISIHFITTYTRSPLKLDHFIWWSCFRDWTHNNFSTCSCLWRSSNAL